jgi:hypothetical protein
MVKTLDIFIAMLGAATLLWFAARSTLKSKRLRIPVKATMRSGAWRPLDPVDDDQGGAWT